jgi:carbonic anhydrase
MEKNINCIADRVSQSFCRLDKAFKESSELIDSAVDSSAGSFDLASILPEDKSYYTYPGSLVSSWTTET